MDNFEEPLSIELRIYRKSEIRTIQSSSQASNRLQLWQGLMLCSFYGAMVQ
jgi:hypothetical protein